MTAIQFVLGLARLVGIVMPTIMLAHLIRRRYLRAIGSLAVLVETVLAFSLLLVVAEALGLVGLMRPAALIPALFLLAGVVWWLSQRQSGFVVSSEGSADERSCRGLDVTTVSALVAVVVVVAQWCVQTANALGAGMGNFDTLWYHMPFAAHMAQTGSVTGIQLT